MPDGSSASVIASANLSLKAPAATFPRLLLHHAKARPDAPAMREKDLGIWQSWTWSEVRQRVERIAGGLAAAGFQRGMALGVVGENRPRLYWSMLAAQSLGGIPVPVYQDAIAKEMAYVIANAEIQFVVVEDQEQVDKLLEIRDSAAGISHIYFDDPSGLKHYDDPALTSLDALEAAGSAYAHSYPGFFEREIELGKPEDTAVILYTSGTTGHPKGVCQSHEGFIAAAAGDIGFDGFTDQDEILSYLPMAWVGDHLFSYAQALVAGFRVNCPESAETVMTDLREIGPTYYFAPPRVYENMLTSVMIRMEDAGRLKRTLFKYFMAVAKRVGGKVLDGKPVPFAERALYALGNLTIYGPLRNVLGMSRLRVAYTGGASIGPDLFDFYRSIGINLKQLYGQTETCVYVCKQPDGQVKLDTVGKPLPGVEIRIGDNGEVLVKSPGLLKEYFKRPDATAESLTEDQWFRTGDAGFFDSEGHLKIIDRAKDVGRMQDGTLFAPQYIENKLKFFPHIKEAVAFGDQRDEVVVMINIDMTAVGDWAERRNLPYSGYTDLAGKDAVAELVQQCVEQVNDDLAQDAKLAGSQVARFVILHKELDADDEELTRTRKVRRGFIGQKYAVIVDALYGGAKNVPVETQVKFEDGRTGLIRADLRIHSATVARQARAVADGAAR
jgi:long-chain acyl-CoA synthetase